MVVVAAVAMAGAVAWLGDPAAHAYALVGITVVWGALALVGAPTLASPGHVVIAAMLVRAPLLLLEPTLSDDAWRYLWEGTVWRAGFNPFEHAPDDPALAELRDAVWVRVNHRAVPSVYPPLAQALFALLTGGGVLAWRLVSAGCDIVTSWMLARVRPRAGWLWALLPLPALESAVSGHLEGIGVALLVAALTTRRAGFAWAGAMVKLLPGVLLLRERPRAWVGWGLLTVLVAAPMVRPEGIAIYGATWSFNGSVFPLAAALLGDHARPALQILGAAIVAIALSRTHDRARLALWATGAFVLLSPTVHPWYVLWPLAAALLNGMRAWEILAVTVPASYLVLATYDPTTSRWTEWPAVRVLVYAPFFVALATEAWRRATRAGPAAV